MVRPSEPSLNEVAIMSTKPYMSNYLIVIAQEYPHQKYKTTVIRNPILRTNEIPRKIEVHLFSAG